MMIMSWNYRGLGNLSDGSRALLIGEAKETHFDLLNGDKALKGENGECSDMAWFLKYVRG
jgi:hypothetical protein